MKEKFGQLYQIGEKDFVNEVSKAGQDLWVILHLFIYSKVECQLLNQCMSTLAPKFRAIKFLKIVANECIHNYPTQNCPTILIYRNGDVAKQIVGLEMFGGLKMTAKSLEWTLAQSGVLTTDLEEDPRKKQPLININRSFITKGAKAPKANDDNDDDDDDQD